MNMFEDLIGAADINGLTGGAAGALLPPPYGMDTSVAPTAENLPSWLTSTLVSWFQENLGGLLAGFALLAIGLVMLFSGSLETIAKTIGGAATTASEIVPEAAAAVVA